MAVLCQASPFDQSGMIEATRDQGPSSQYGSWDHKDWQASTQRKGHMLLFLDKIVWSQLDRN